MITFPERAKTHLAAYKKEVLKIEKDGIWIRNSKLYPHILPQEFALRNLVTGVLPDFERLRARREPSLHRDFHHLTSSQALAFNLFVPLDADWPGFRAEYGRLLDLTDRQITGMEIEVIDKEDQTNFDGVAAISGSSRAIFEVKFTETEFGAAELNDSDQASPRHQRKLRQIYRPRLEGRVSEECFEERHFFSNYQLYRNLSALRRSHDDKLVLLIPRSHEKIWKIATEWSEHRRLLDLRKAIKVLAVEDVIDVLESIRPMKEITRAYLRDLRDKYAFDVF